MFKYDYIQTPVKSKYKYVILTNLAMSGEAIKFNNLIKF